MKKLFLFIFLFLLLLPSLGWGASIYLRDSAASPGTKICYKTGSMPDAACTGGTDSSYFANASTAAGVGGSITVNSGTYVLAQLHSSGTAGFNTQAAGQTISCLVAGTCTINGTGVAVGDAIFDIISGHNGTTITGFLFTGGSSNTPQLRCSGATGAIVTHNTFQNGTWGGVGYQLASTGFTHSYNFHQGVAGATPHISISGTAAGTVIYNIFGASSTNPGSFISHSSSGTSTIYNNDVIGSYVYSLLVSAGTVNATNNIFAAGHSPGTTVYTVTTNGSVSITGGTVTLANNYVDTSQFQSATEPPIEGTYTDGGGNILLDGNTNTSATSIGIKSLAKKSFLSIQFDGDFFDFINPLASVVHARGGHMTLGMTGAIYNEGSKVIGSADGRTYTCILTHTSAADNRPTSGGSWATYWRLAPELSTGVAWVTGTAYTGYLTKLASYLADGHSIMSHTRSHSEMNQTSAFDLTYIGTDTNATVQVVGSDTVPQIILTTTETNDNVTITGDTMTMMMNLPDLSAKIGFDTACTGACKWKLTKIVRNMSPTGVYYTTGFLNLTSLATLAPAAVGAGKTISINQSDTTTGFYKDEWVDWKSEIEAIVLASNGSSFTLTTAAQPFAQHGRSELSAAQLGYIKDAGFTSFRYISGGYDDGVTNLDLRKLNLYKMESLNILSVLTYTTTTAQATAIGRLMANYLNYNPILLCLYFHGVGGINGDTAYPTQAVIGAFLDALIANAPNVQLVTFPAAIAYIKDVANGWTTADNITFTNTGLMNIGYNLQLASPAINAGTNVGLTSDYEGNPVPYSNTDIGCYEHQGAIWILGP